MKYLTVLLTLISLASCNRVDDVESTYSHKESKFNDLVTFELGEQVTLFLDSVTSPVSSSIQYNFAKGVPGLAYWNNNDKSIVYFDIERGTVLGKQFFERTGPNTVYASNFLVHAEDSIFMTDAVQSTYLVDEESQVLNRYRVEDAKELTKSPSPYVWTGSPMVFTSDNLYFQAYVGGVFDQPNIGRLNLTRNEVDYFGGYPDFYKKAYWRGGFEYMYLTYNSEQKLIVQSYAADHHVRVINLLAIEEEQKAYFAGTNDFSFVKPPRERMGDPGHELDDRKFMLQPSFGMIHYDRFNKLYYRFAFDGLTESDIDSDDPNRSSVKPSRVIILNSGFSKVGEYKLPRFRYALNMSFVGENGLYLKVKNEENEDILQFDIFKPVHRVTNN